MSLEEEIRKLLEKDFMPSHLTLTNESAKHRGHSGDDGSGQTHFKLELISKRFLGLSRVERERLVLICLKPAFEKGLHAITMLIGKDGD